MNSSYCATLELWGAEGLKGQMCSGGTIKELAQTPWKVTHKAEATWCSLSNWVIPSLALSWFQGQAQCYGYADKILRTGPWHQPSPIPLPEQQPHAASGVSHMAEPALLTRWWLLVGFLSFEELKPTLKFPSVVQ